MTAAGLDFGALTAHLVRRGLIATMSGATVRPLAGGVSNDVVAVTAPGLDAVVKQALGRLRVAEEWLADPERIDTEGRALRLAGRLLPGAVPAVYDLADGFLVIERAPDRWRTWIRALLGAAALLLAVLAASGAWLWWDYRPDRDQWIGTVHQIAAFALLVAALALLVLSPIVAETTNIVPRTPIVAVFVRK